MSLFNQSIPAFMHMLKCGEVQNEWMGRKSRPAEHPVRLLARLSMIQEPVLISINMPYGWRC